MQDVLQMSVLVLNRNWMPIAVSTVADAIGHLYTGGATVVDHETFITYTWDDWAERGVRPDRPFVPGARDFKFECPEVIVLAEYDKVPQRTVNYSKSAVFKREHNCCAYCGEQFEKKELTIDHVVPRSQRGRTTWENCVASCRKCNETKADRTPKQAGMRLRVDPKKPSWMAYRRLAELAATRPAWQPFVKT